MNRPDGDPARPHTVAPGAYGSRAPGREPRIPRTRPSTTPSCGGIRTVLHLGAASSFGLRRDDLIVKDGDMFAVEERMAEYERWRAERGGDRGRASGRACACRPRPRGPRQRRELGIDDEIAAAGSDRDRRSCRARQDRPRGPRFGTLVHAVLATVPLDASRRGRAARRPRRRDGCCWLVRRGDPRRRGRGVARCCGTTSWRARARRRRVRRETPVTWLQKDGTLIEGVLDLAFEESGVTIVVDFKTDHELAAGEVRYRAQVQQYVNAVARATGLPATGVLFKV